MAWARKVGGSNLIQLIQQLILEKGLDVEGVAPVVTRGNIFHRLSTPLDSSGCITNAPLHIMTHVKFSTSGMRYYQEGERDWTIFFQSAFQYLGTLLTQCGYNLALNRLVYGYFECGECTTLVPESIIDIAAVIPTPSIGVPVPTVMVLSQASSKPISFSVGAKLAESLRKNTVHSAAEQNDLQGVPVLVCQTKLGDRDHRSKKILSKDPCPEMNRLASRRMK